MPHIINSDSQPFIPEGWTIEEHRKGGCWVWKRAKDKEGYGLFAIGIKQKNGSFRTKNFRAHRLIYQLLKGSLKKKDILDHLCRNKACVNPKHLEIVTNAENIRRGKSAKLNKEDIKKVWKFHREGKQNTEIAKVFGVHKATIGLIINKKNWQAV